MKCSFFWCVLFLSLWIWTHPGTAQSALVFVLPCTSPNSSSHTNVCSSHAWGHAPLCVLLVPSANLILAFCLIRWDLHSPGILVLCFQLKSLFLGFLIASALITNQRQDYFQVLLSSCAKNNGVSPCLPGENNFYLLHMGFSHRQFYRHLHDLSPRQLIRSRNTACWFWSNFEQ